MIFIIFIEFPIMKKIKQPKSGDSFAHIPGSPNRMDFMLKFSVTDFWVNSFTVWQYKLKCVYGLECEPYLMWEFHWVWKDCC
jgi:hypothetical protein